MNKYLPLILAVVVLVLGGLATFHVFTTQTQDDIYYGFQTTGGIFIGNIVSEDGDRFVLDNVYTPQNTESGLSIIPFDKKVYLLKNNVSYYQEMDEESEIVKRIREK